MLNSECAKNLKKTSMELGGNAPFIVFEDANLEKAVNGKSNRVLCVVSSLRNCRLDLVKVSLLWSDLCLC
jgi:hypothetical protein